MNESTGASDKRKRVARLLVIPIIATIIGSFLLVGVRALPSHNLESHIAQASRQLSQESQASIYPQALLPDSSFRASNWNRDNVTDAAMLSIALPNPSLSPLQSAFQNLHYPGGEENGSPSATPIEALEHSLSDEGSEPTLSYARYWHGYQIVLIPLLEVLSYNAIRALAALVLLAETAVVLVLLARETGSWTVSVTFAASLLVTSCFVVPFSLQFISVFMISLGGMIAALLLHRTHDSSTFDLELFAILATLTIYFDFLTVPLITLGLPLLVVLLLDQQDGASLRDGLIRAARCSVVWVLSAGLFWAIKWGLSSLIAGGNVVDNALSAASAQSVGGSASLAQSIVEHIQALTYNIAALLPDSLYPSVLGRSLIVLGLLGLVALAWVIAYRMAHLPRKQILRSLPFLLVSTYPLIWYSLLASHSRVHYWFTNRSLVVSVFGISLFFLSSISRTDLLCGKNAARRNGNAKKR